LALCGDREEGPGGWFATEHTVATERRREKEEKKGEG